MATTEASPTQALPSDRIAPVTRWVAVLVMPILLLAFAILFFVPDQSGTRFAWNIQPAMTARFIGAGYLGGAYFFARVAIGRRWHRVARGFLPVGAFTWAMLGATLLHWDRFDPQHFPFQLWLILYVITPILLPWLWWRNRRADPGLAGAGDVRVPAAFRWLTGIAGLLLSAYAVFSFALPGAAIGLWPWSLTPLTARVLAGWFALLGLGNLAVALEPRWSAWRAPMESILVWQVCVLVAAALSPQDFSSVVNWYLIGVAAALSVMVLIYVSMEIRRRRGPPQAEHLAA